MYASYAAREVKDVRYAARAVKDVCFTAFCIVCHVVARPDLPELREYGLCIPRSSGSKTGSTRQFSYKAAYTYFSASVHFMGSSCLEYENT